MTDEDDRDTQWTPAARNAHTARGEQLLRALREHVTLTLARSGRRAEDAGYFASTSRLQRAAAAFREAEFDWCGSFPLGLDTDRWDDDENGEDEDEQGESSILTVVGRWDYRITDEPALIAAGRATYARIWVDDTEEDATIAVSDSAGAASEIAHADGWGALSNTDGLDSLASTQTVIIHEDDGASSIDDDDPFAITRAD